MVSIHDIAHLYGNKVKSPFDLNWKVVNIVIVESHLAGNATYTSLPHGVLINTIYLSTPDLPSGGHLRELDRKFQLRELGLRQLRHRACLPVNLSGGCDFVPSRAAQFFVTHGLEFTA